MTTSSIADVDLQTLLTHADRRTLAAVVTHLSGDPNAIPDLSDRAAIEAKAAAILPGFISGDRTPPIPDDELLQAAMNKAIGIEVPIAYRAYVREQTGIGPVQPVPPLIPPPGFRVVVIGAGLSGVLVARLLLQSGVTDVDLLEKRTAAGGTWYQNTYPGCRVDTPSLLYSFSFDQDPGWPEHFSPQPEVLKYVQRVVAEGGLTDRLQLGSEVVGLQWQETESSWLVDVKRHDGSCDTIAANAVVLAPGLLSMPKLPDIPGFATFEGASMHSGEWDSSIDLAGKRVAVIGSGASAQQIVPAIAPIAAHVTAYQRSPQWLTSHPKYGQKLDGIERQLFDRIPTYREWNRVLESWRFGDAMTNVVKVDPTWPHQQRSCSAESEQLRLALIDYIHGQVGDRPDLLEKVVPNYPPYAKRMLIDSGWYQALRRDNVYLETDAVLEITATGIRTAAGENAVDVIIYATGFHADRYLWPIQVTGRGGIDVTKQMVESPQAYLGVAMTDCPNLFITPGPNAYLGHGGNAMLFAECHARYIIECLRALFTLNANSMVVKASAVEKYVKEVDEGLADWVQNTPGVDSWFKGDRARIVTIAPKTVIEFWQDYRQPDTGAFDFISDEHGAV